MDTTTLIQSTELDDYLTPTELADLLKFRTPRPIYAAIKSGELPAFDLGRHKRVAREDLLGWLNRNRVQPEASAVTAAAPTRARSADDVLAEVA